MKIQFKNPIYDYGCCGSCKNCLVGKHGWLLWCKKEIRGINFFNKCHLYKVKRNLIK